MSTLPPPPLAPPGEPRLTAAGIVGLALIAASLVAVALVGVLVMRPFAAAPATTEPGAAFVATPAPAPALTLTPDPPASPSSATPGAPSPTPAPVAGGSVGPAPSAAPSTIRLPKLAGTIAGATAIHYYAIAGDAPLDLVRQMERKGSTHCEADALACVHLSVDPHVTYRLDFTTGACTIVRASPTLSAVVYLPRWSKPARVQRPLLGWWRDVFGHITWHEGRHIRIEKAWMRKLSDRLEGKPCASAAKIVRRWASQVAAAQDAFDARELATFRYPAYAGPGGWDGTSVP